MNAITSADPAATPADRDAALTLPAPPMPTSGAALRLLATLSVVVAMWWGRSFLIPVTAGLILAVMVAPLTHWLTQVVRSRAGAAVLSMVLVVVVLGLAAAGFGTQLARVADRAPDMISLVAQQLSQTEPGADSVLARARQAFGELDRAAERISGTRRAAPPPGRRAAAAAAAAASAAPTPAAVDTAQSATVVLRETAVSSSGALFHFLGDLTLVLFVAFFALAGSTPLVVRFLDLWGNDPPRRVRAASALHEGARQIHLYGGVLLITNTLIGLLIWGAFSAAGLPDAAGWGVAAGVLHVVPYLGMALLTALGTAETFLAHGSVLTALGMAAFIVLLSTVVGTVVTAILQGHAARMNPTAVFIGVVFWGVLWGVWGLLLGPALVVLTKVVAEHTSMGRRFAGLMAA